MCRSMVDIQSPTAEIRREKKEDRRKERRKKLHDENIMVCPITYGDHKQELLRMNIKPSEILSQQQMRIMHHYVKT